MTTDHLVAYCWLMLLLSLRALSALVMLVLMQCLLCMEEEILPKDPRQLPAFLNRSPLNGRAMTCEDCLLEKLGKFMGNDSQGVGDGGVSSCCDEQLIHSLVVLMVRIPLLHLTSHLPTW